MASHTAPLPNTVRLRSNTIQFHSLSSCPVFTLRTSAIIWLNIKGTIFGESITHHNTATITRI